MSTEEPRPSWERERGHSRSFFWPILLIGIGILLLLAQTGVIAEINWWSLLRLWPVLLIVAGLDLLFGRRTPLLGALLGLLVIVAVGWFFIWGGGLERASDVGLRDAGGRFAFLGLSAPTELQHAHYEEPLGQAESAKVILDLGSCPTEVTALISGDDLIDAEIDYWGQMRFDVSGTRSKTIVLDEIRSGINLTNFGKDASCAWDIGLSPELPLDLVIDAGSGSASLELEGLDLRSLEIDGGSGWLDIWLPYGCQQVRIDGGSGRSKVDIAEGADLDFELETGSGHCAITVGDAVDLELNILDAGSGSLTISVPPDAAVQLSVLDDGSGQVRLPKQIAKVKDGSSRNEGTWESKGFDRAEHPIYIQVDDMGSGSLTIEYTR